MTDATATVARARDEFLTLVEAVRPELHRYCARLTGSVIEGEDIVQETLAKAFYALGLETEVPSLRPWLFRVAHNTAVDYLRSHGKRFTEARDDLDEVAAFDDRPDPIVVRSALAQFVELPLTQRSAVILKDVLGHSLEETADTMGTTVLAVKAALVRGRRNLRETSAAEGSPDLAVRARLDRYATLFNRRDWDGVRALIGDECQLDLVAKARRRGKEVGAYFARYEKQNVSLSVVSLEGRLAFAAFVAGAQTASYFVLLDWDGDRVKSIRDYRYVPYIAAEATYETLG
ncbi:MAG TPA: sigma-70 family RNA polymerase sigma factor [Polyangiaceae bacterium]|jgi:RNA polymerase sigma-70 factor (ECF subfamily)|nr:sigma-70 family RNA polymerase sigma factor [Polyangiaceae bacterium]